jgi:hypothetical protein
MFGGFLRRLIYRKDYRRKQKAGKDKLRKHQKALRKELRKEYRKERNLRIRKFLANPFARKTPTADQVAKLEMKAQIRNQKREERYLWYQRFKHNPVRTLLVKEKNEELAELEKWRKVNKKFAFKNRLRITVEAFTEIVKNSDLRKRFLKGLLQSTAYFILAFLFIYIIYQIVTIVVARGFNIPTVWYYYRVKFPLFTGSHLYTRSALISIFSAGPLISLALAFLFLQRFFNRKTVSQNLKLFFLWGFICGINMFFGSYIAGFITRTEFIYVTEWIFMSSIFDVEEIIFAVTAITISLLIGRLVTPLFLLSTGSSVLIEQRFRFYYILSHVIFPWMVGVVVFFFLTTPTHYFPLFLKTLTPVIILMPVIVTHNSAKYTSIQASGVVRRSYFRWSIIIAVIALLFFYRIILNFGLQFF